MFYKQINVKFKDPSLEAVTVWPFIFVNKDLPIRSYWRVMTHELTHLKQQLSLLLIGFYLWYYIEFLIRRLQYPTWDEAYRNISFEREAYANQRISTYYKTRPFWGHLKYL